MWLAEESMYAGSYNSAVGHFTQVRVLAIAAAALWGLTFACGCSLVHFSQHPLTSRSPHAPSPTPQAVWKATTQVGCGLARCGSGVIVTCHYTPPGNVLGAFSTNV